MSLFKIISELISIKKTSCGSLAKRLKFLFLKKSDSKGKQNQFKRKRIAMSKSLKVEYENESSHFNVEMEIGGIIRKMLRPSDELVEHFFGRIISNFQKLSKKKNKKLKTGKGTSINLTDSPTIDLFDYAGKKLHTDMKCLEALQIADTLLLSGTAYKVEYNYPTVTMLELTSNPMVGIPLFPKLAFSRASIPHSKFSWLRSKKKRTTDNQDVDEFKLSLTDNDWEFISSNMVYTASNEDIDYLLKIQVHPGNQDTTKSNDFHAMTGFVVEGPGECIFDARHKFTEHQCGNNSLRVVCYNILADCYAMTEFAEKQLFPYCPNHIRDINYRIQLIIKELKGYHSDIVCLQEVDSSVFQGYLVSAMSLQNYAGAFAAKLNVKEGVALFYNRNKFKLVSVENKILQESLFNDDFNETLRNKICKSSKLKNFVKHRSTCVLMAVLECLENPGVYLISANTHLYFHPKASHLRMIQTSIILNILQHTINETKRTYPSAKISYMLCGDLNSRPTSGVVELIEKAHIPATHADWFLDMEADFYDKVTDLNLSHDLQFLNASGRPKYTNYVETFNECLDYIFVDPDLLKVDKVVPPPGHELVTKHLALPSLISPSDHIAQIVDLTWKN